MEQQRNCQKPVAHAAKDSSNRVKTDMPYPICTAVYPETAAYPTVDWESSFDRWSAGQYSRRRKQGYAACLTPFFIRSCRQYLHSADGQNRSYSPLNLCMALSMLAEITDGSSRGQILSLLGTDSIEEQRTLLEQVWTAHYQNDGATTSVLANSLWLDSSVPFRQTALDRLSEFYYASSFTGKVGSSELDVLLRDWLNEQTGGLLKEKSDTIGLDPGSLLALASTVYFRAKWDKEFWPGNTSPAIFHGRNGDATVNFLHQQSTGDYYWGRDFIAVCRKLANLAGSMWFLLPNKGRTPDDLLRRDEGMELILSGGKWDRQEWVQLNQFIPKFDVTGSLELSDGLKALGVTDIFAAPTADFSPITEIPALVSQIQQDSRVAIDEEGVTAASYTVIPAAYAAKLPDKVIDFILDRPFLYAITGNDGLPLFVGTVNQII